MLRAQKAEFVVPQSIDWARQPWAEEFVKRRESRIFSPTGEGMRIERERDFARKLCQEFKIPFPRAYVAASQLEAEGKSL